MIDWPAKVIELKQMADELELQATRLQDRGKLVLGRTADELRRFAAQIERALADPDEGRLKVQPIPDWLAAMTEEDESESEPEVGSYQEGTYQEELSEEQASEEFVTYEEWEEDGGEGEMDGNARASW